MNIGKDGGGRKMGMKEGNIERRADDWKGRGEENRRREEREEEEIDDWERKRGKEERKGEEDRLGKEDRSEEGRV